MTSILRLLATASMALTATACAGTNAAPIVPGAQVQISSAGAPGVYVALGASDTVGVGSDNPAREAWPQVFYVAALPRAAVAYNLGVVGTLTGSAVDDQLPAALALHATLATVFLGVNDLLHAVPAGDFERSLDTIVAALRGAGAQVLLADIPVLHSLPVVRACAARDSTLCPPDTSVQIEVTSIAQLDQRVADFNAAIRRIAANRGATLVDLSAQGDQVAAQPGLVSDDGFHPSDAGHRLLAQEFAQALLGARAATA